MITPVKLAAGFTEAVGNLAIVLLMFGLAVLLVQLLIDAGSLLNDPYLSSLVLLSHESPEIFGIENVNCNRIICLFGYCKCGPS